MGELAATSLSLWSMYYLTICQKIHYCDSDQPQQQQIVDTNIPCHEFISFDDGETPSFLRGGIDAYLEQNVFDIPTQLPSLPPTFTATSYQTIHTSQLSNEPLATSLPTDTQTSQPTIVTSGHPIIIITTSPSSLPSPQPSQTPQVDPSTKP